MQLALRDGINVSAESREEIERQLEEMIDTADAVDASCMRQAIADATKRLDARL